MKRSLYLLRRSNVAVLCVVFVCGLSMEVVAENKNAPTSVSAETLEARIHEAEATTDLDAETKSRLIELYRKTLSDLKKVESNNAAAETFRQSIGSALQEAEALRKKLERRTPHEVTLGVSKTAPLPDIEQALIREQANLAAAEAELAGLDEQLDAQADRPGAVRKRLTEVGLLKEEAARKIRLSAEAGESAAVSEARRWKGEIRALALSSESRMLQQELLSQPMRVDLLRAKREEALNAVEAISSKVDRLEELVFEQRRANADSAMETAEAVQRDVEGKHPLLQDLAGGNAALSELIASLTTDLERATEARDEASKEAKRITEAFQRTSKKLAVAGLSQTLGIVLYEQRRALPSTYTLQRVERKNEEKIAAASLRHLRNQEEHVGLRNVEEYVAGLLEPLPSEESEQIRRETAELVNKREVLLKQVLQVDETYIRILSDLDHAQRQFLDAVRTYDGYLAGRLLWVKTAEPPECGDVADHPHRGCLARVTGRLARRRPDRRHPDSAFAHLHLGAGSFGRAALEAFRPPWRSRSLQSARWPTDDGPVRVHVIGSLFQSAARGPVVTSRGDVWVVASQSPGGDGPFQRGLDRARISAGTAVPFAVLSHSVRSGRPGRIPLCLGRHDQARPAPGTRTVYGPVAPCRLRLRHACRARASRPPGRSRPAGTDVCDKCPGGLLLWLDRVSPRRATSPAVPISNQPGLSPAATVARSRPQRTTDSRGTGPFGIRILCGGLRHQPGTNGLSGCPLGRMSTSWSCAG